MLNNNKSKSNLLNEYINLNAIKEEKNIYFDKNSNNNINFNSSFPQETCESCSSSINNIPIYLSDLEKSINESISQIEEINSKKIKNILEKINKFTNSNKNSKNENIKYPLLQDTISYKEEIDKYLEYELKKEKEENEIEEEKIKKNKILLQNSSNNYSQQICSICNNGDIDHNQLMFECESCGLTVHQNCYGIKSQILTNWICDPCKEMSKDEVLNLECVLCPIKGGAMKKIDLPFDSHFYKEIIDYRRSNGKKIPLYNSHIIIPFEKYDNIKCAWVHLSCALWNPNIEIGNYDEKKDIKNIDRIDFCKFNEKCDICNFKFYGPVLKCNYNDCNFKFHPECARINNFCMEVEAIEQDLKYNIYCFQHYQNQLVKTIEKNNMKSNKEISDFNNILSKIISNYQKIYHNNILSNNLINCQNLNCKGEYSILNINKKKFIITLKKEYFVKDYFNKNSFRNKNRNYENDYLTPKKNNNSKKNKNIISVIIPGKKRNTIIKPKLIKLKKNSELSYLSRLRKICLEYSKYNSFVVDKNIINSNNSTGKKKKKRNNNKKNIIESYSLNNSYDLFKLLKYEDLLSINFPWDKVNFKNFSKEKCKQYFIQLIPNEKIFNERIKNYSEVNNHNNNINDNIKDNNNNIINNNENNNNNNNNINNNDTNINLNTNGNIIGISLNDDMIEINSDSLNIQNVVEIKIENDSKENI